MGEGGGVKATYFCFKILFYILILDIILVLMSSPILSKYL